MFKISQAGPYRANSPQPLATEKSLLDHYESVGTAPVQPASRFEAAQQKIQSNNWHVVGQGLSELKGMATELYPEEAEAAWRVIATKQAGLGSLAADWIRDAVIALAPQLPGHRVLQGWHKLNTYIADGRRFIVGPALKAQAALADRLTSEQIEDLLSAIIVKLSAGDNYGTPEYTAALQELSALGPVLSSSQAGLCWDLLTPHIDGKHGPQILQAIAPLAGLLPRDYHGKAWELFAAHLVDKQSGINPTVFAALEQLAAEIDNDSAVSEFMDEVLRRLNDFSQPQQIADVAYVQLFAHRLAPSKALEAWQTLTARMFAAQSDLSSSIPGALRALARSLNSGVLIDVLHECSERFRSDRGNNFDKMVSLHLLLAMVPELPNGALYHLADLVLALRGSDDQNFVLLHKKIVTEIAARMANNDYGDKLKKLAVDLQHDVSFLTQRAGKEPYLAALTPGQRRQRSYDLVDRAHRQEHKAIAAYHAYLNDIESTGISSDELLETAIQTAQETRDNWRALESHDQKCRDIASPVSQSAWESSLERATSSVAEWSGVVRAYARPGQLFPVPPLTMEDLLDRPFTKVVAFKEETRGNEVIQTKLLQNMFSNRDLVRIQTTYNDGKQVNVTEMTGNDLLLKLKQGVEPQDYLTHLKELGLPVVDIEVLAFESHTLRFDGTQIETMQNIQRASQAYVEHIEPNYIGRLI